MSNKFSELAKVRIQQVQQPIPEPEAPKKIGRPRAKRSNPEYTQVTAYIKLETHLEVKERLVRKQQEFSELLEELLSGWLQGKA